MDKPNFKYEPYALHAVFDRALTKLDNPDTLPILEELCRDFLEQVVAHNSMKIHLRSFTIKARKTPNSHAQLQQNYEDLQRKFIQMRNEYTKEIVGYKTNVRGQK